MAKLSIFDAHVRQAWSSELFSDGSKIKHKKRGREQGFFVQSNGLFEKQLIAYTDTKCRNGDIISNGKLVLPRNGSYAAGHTHPKGHEQTPGPLDGLIAKNRSRYGSAGYVIAARGAYRIEFVRAKNIYMFTRIAGVSLASSEIERLNAAWGVVKPRSEFKSDKDFVCQ